VDLLLIDENGKVISGSDHRYDELGDIGKSLGMRWGGDFAWGRDAGHFEYHPGLTIEEVCPDSSEELCYEQIARHNAQNTPPVDPVVIQQVESTNNNAGISLGQILVSAAVGAVVYKAVFALFDAMNGKK
jgi:hypothetical protein